MPYFDPLHKEPDSAAPIVESNAVKLPTPTLSLTATGQNSLSATIGASENATGYILQVATDLFYTANVQTFYVTGTSKSITGLNPSTTYYGNVQAVGSGFLFSDRSGASATTQGVPNVAPTVSAGNATSVQLPTSSVSLNATASDSDGTIVSYLWTQVSGPNTATIANASQASTTASGLVQGSYVFRVTATDDDGATTSANKTVTVAQSQLTAYYGTKTDGTTLSEGAIQAGASVAFSTGADVTVDFSSNQVPAYLWYAEPSTEPLKTKWQDTVNIPNNGNIGTEEDLFNAPTIVGGYRFYITTYATTTAYPTQFKKS